MQHFISSHLVFHRVAIHYIVCVCSLFVSVCVRKQNRIDIWAKRLVILLKTPLSSVLSFTNVNDSKNDWKHWNPYMGATTSAIFVCISPSPYLVIVPVCVCVIRMYTHITFFSSIVLCGCYVMLCVRENRCFIFGSARAYLLQLNEIGSALSEHFFVVLN